MYFCVSYLLLVMAICGIRTGLTGRILMPSLMTQSRYGRRPRSDMFTARSLPTCSSSSCCTRRCTWRKSRDQCSVMYEPRNTDSSSEWNRQVIITSSERSLTSTEIFELNCSPFVSYSFFLCSVVGVSENKLMKYTQC